MTIDKLSRLFSALGGSSQGYSSTNSSGNTKEAETQPQGGEAVRFASDFGKTESSSDAAARKARVDELKAAVQSGSYKVDSYKIAEAVARDLFA